MTLTFQMMMLEDHEMKKGFPPCDTCGKLLVHEEGFVCSHCYTREAEPDAKCPVCECAEIPDVFFDSDMTEELARLEKARASFRKRTDFGV